MASSSAIHESTISVQTTQRFGTRRTLLSCARTDLDHAREHCACIGASIARRLISVVYGMDLLEATTQLTFMYEY